jgi:phage gp29-like protein
MNTTNSSTAARAKRWRFNPLTNLQPTTLARILDAFEAGYLREAALVWEALEQRDDLLRTVISKRKKSVARHGWTVLPLPNATAAEKARAAEHIRALEHFYDHLQCEHAVDTAERGGFKLLARQMMDAVGKRFAAHEIIWREAEGTTRTTTSSGAVSGANRNFVEAKFRFVPLAFFENTTGRLRFLESDSAQEGRELEPGAWMVTAGEGLMVASSTAWMFKHISLDDWLRCSQRNGRPALGGISAAARDSAEWNALEQAVADILEGQAVVHSAADKVEVLDLMAGGHIPFPELVERIDRMLASLWRGADLSTMSRDRGYGASLQEKETCALEEDDAEMLTETLNRYVDEWVIRHVFGPDEKPLARVKVLVTPRECTTEDLRVDEFLLRHGAPLSLQETMNRYGRTLPKSGEPVLLMGTSKASLPESSQKLGSAEEMENEGFGCGPTVSFRGCSPSVPLNLNPNLTLNPPPPATRQTRAEQD